MRHRIAGRKFNRDSAQRKALLVGLAKALIKHEQITTTLPKAKDLRPFVEKLITFGKKGGLSSRRILISKLGDNDLVKKLCDTLSKRFENRQGGYTRIVKCGFRKGDMAPAAVIGFVEEAKPSVKKASTDNNKAESTL